MQQGQGEGRGSAHDGTRPGSQVVSLRSAPACLLLNPSQIMLLDFHLPPNCEASYCEKQVTFAQANFIQIFRSWRVLIVGPWTMSLPSCANLFLSRC